MTKTVPSFSYISMASSTLWIYVATSASELDLHAFFPNILTFPFSNVLPSYDICYSHLISSMPNTFIICHCLHCSHSVEMNFSHLHSSCSVITTWHSDTYKNNDMAVKLHWICSADNGASAIYYSVL
jgi:hypothetical protein